MPKIGYGDAKDNPLLAKDHARNNFNISNAPSSSLRLTSTEKPISSYNASNANAQVALNKKMRALQKAQNKAVRTQTFSDGRIRYYEAVRPAKKALESTSGSSYVTEFNPATGQVRSWNECYDHMGNVNRIHPKMIDGQQVSGQHYPLTKTEVEAVSKKMWELK